MGLSINPENGYVTALLQVKMKEVRYFSEGDFFDTVLMMFDTSGTVEKVVSISNSDLAYDMFSANQGILQVNGEPYFTGWSYGFATRQQRLTKDETDPDFDLYVYRH